MCRRRRLSRNDTIRKNRSFNRVSFRQIKVDNRNEESVRRSVIKGSVDERNRQTTFGIVFLESASSCETPQRLNKYQLNFCDVYRNSRTDTTEYKRNRIECLTDGENGFFINFLVLYHSQTTRPLVTVIRTHCVPTSRFSNAITSFPGEIRLWEIDSSANENGRNREFADYFFLSLSTWYITWKSTSRPPFWSKWRTYNASDVFHLGFTACFIIIKLTIKVD